MVVGEIKTLILGAGGMLGTDLRANFPQAISFTHAELDITDKNAVFSIIERLRPELVINAAAYAKVDDCEDNKELAFSVNGTAPGYIAEACGRIGSKLVHFSTDCVFSGRRGNYRETDVSDAEDLYGRTKYLGETTGQHCLTLRTSIIGRELARKSGLLEWFLAQRGKVKGYTKAVFSGFTTLEMARIIDNVLAIQAPLSGVYHVSSELISKFDLLTMIRDALSLPIEIEPDDEFKCDRSLDSARFRDATGYRPPAWKTMIEELAQDIRGAGR